MNEFDSVQIGNPGSETCDKCGMHNADNECCFDDVKVLKLKESHLAAELLIASFSLPEAVFTTTEFLLTSLENFDLEESSYPRHGPPLLSEHKTYLQNRVFRV